MSSDQHLLAAYGQADSWTLGYNLFADVWLGTNLVESSVCARGFSFFADLYRVQVYNGQSNYLENMTSNSTVGNFGMPADSLGAGTIVAYSS